ncbi:hypothetical protein N7539_008488 [Penicillium diatomitis]|uniref:GED domain-containing protein n=1 Tax=Penicillium diatomitis TaxID=2819901 RepID=A0A9W9WQT0_9EURO|nr:uncharacterized protein N7539_008488 [Penicillium diatomitis]KAJ5471919.1 hypothetical protein N7539_008488 [Penicillium diatomitis]
MPADLVMKIAGESKESQSIREQLNKELVILVRGSETCKRFVRTKLDGISTLPVTETELWNLILATGRLDARSDDKYLTMESSSGSICEEMAPEVVGSYFADSSRQSRRNSVVVEMATSETTRSNISDPSTDTPNSPGIPDATIDESSFSNVEAVSSSFEPVDVVPATVEETATLSDHEPTTKEKMKKKKKKKEKKHFKDFA